MLSRDWSSYEKYGARVLELEGLPWEELVKWQIWAYVAFFIKNFRILDLIKFILTKRRGVYFFIKSCISFRDSKKKRLRVST